jgi:hypothetical protein
MAEPKNSITQQHKFNHSRGSRLRILTPLGGIGSGLGHLEFPVLSGKPRPGLPLLPQSLGQRPLDHADVPIMPTQF